jgi:hypothetical protein
LTYIFKGREIDIIDTDNHHVEGIQVMKAYYTDDQTNLTEDEMMEAGSLFAPQLEEWALKHLLSYEPKERR